MNKNVTIFWKKYKKILNKNYIKVTKKDVKCYFLQLAIKNKINIKNIKKMQLDKKV